MNFDLDDDLVQLQEAVRKAIGQTSPVAQARRLAETPVGYDAQFWRQTCALGWVGADPDDPQPLVTAAVVAEEFGRGLVPSPFLPVSVALSVLRACGARSEVVDRLAGGDGIASWCLAEPGGDWSPAVVR